MTRWASRPRVPAALAALAVPVVLMATPTTSAAGSAHPARTLSVTCEAPAPAGTSRIGSLLGVVPPLPATRHARCSTGGAPTDGERRVAGDATSPAARTLKGRDYSGAPPISDHGGPVMADGVTVVPIFWDPSNTFAASYKSVVEGYVANVAAEDGTVTNVYSDDLQYGAIYDVHAGTPVVADTAITDGCTPDKGAVYSDHTGYSACVTDAQIQAEVAAVQGADHLPSNLSYSYAVFLPKGVESCFDSRDNAQGGSCTISAQGGSFCAYHSNTDADAIYSDLPFPIYDSPTGYTCGSDASFPVEESPNGQPDADDIVDSFSHELNESITDPFGTAWFDRRGNEIADDCVGFYGATSGSAGALYNQTINGAHYLTQEEFSNEDFHASKDTACIQHLDLPTAVFTTSRHLRAGHAVRFNAKKSKGTITAFAWNFGDGSAVGSGETASHVFTTAGSFSVTLTVTDVTGLRASSSTTVTVG